MLPICQFEDACPLSGPRFDRVIVDHCPHEALARLLLEANRMHLCQLVPMHGAALRHHFQRATYVLGMPSGNGSTASDHLMFGHAKPLAATACLAASGTARCRPHGLESSLFGSFGCYGIWKEVSLGPAPTPIASSHPRSNTTVCIGV